jgi:hypothetical protein
MSAATWETGMPLLRYGFTRQIEKGSEEVRQEAMAQLEELDDIEVVRMMHLDEGMCVYGIARELEVSTKEVRRRLTLAGVDEEEWR